MGTPTMGPGGSSAAPAGLRGEKLSTKLLLRATRVVRTWHREFRQNQRSNCVCKGKGLMTFHKAKVSSARPTAFGLLL